MADAHPGNVGIVSANQCHPFTQVGCQVDAFEIHHHTRWVRHGEVRRRQGRIEFQRHPGGSFQQPSAIAFTHLSPGCEQASSVMLRWDDAPGSPLNASAMRTSGEGTAPAACSGHSTRHTPVVPK
jgi:hypothetical protein